MDKPKLKLGKMTGKEIAEWLGIKYTTYRQNPTKQLLKLRFYCSYEQVRGGAIIKDIYKDTYDKRYNQLICAAYVKAVQNNSLCSVSGLHEEYGFSRDAIAAARNQLYGDKPIEIDPDAHGELGYRSLCWAIKLNGPNNYRYMTETETEKFNSLISIVNGNIPPEILAKKELILQYCVKHNLSAATYQDIIDSKNMNFFQDVILRFRDETGLMAVNISDHQTHPWDKEASDKRKEEILKATLEDLDRYLAAYEAKQKEVKK